MHNDCPPCKAKRGSEAGSNCGKSHMREGVAARYAAHYEVAAPRTAAPLHAPISCMLAYIPGLFWLPLASGRTDETHREFANQGALLSIFSVLFGTAAALILGALWNCGYDFSQIGDLFVGFTVQNWIMRILRILGWLGLTALVMYSPINSICGIFHGLASDRPYRITIFGRLHIIRPSQNV